MINPETLQQISQQALEDFQVFLKQPNNSSKSFCETSIEADRSRIPSLALFIVNLTGATIQNFRSLPAPNYGSWLFTTSAGNSSIYLDQRQMTVWHQETGMPLDIQQLRSIVHELGHLRMNLRLAAGKSGHGFVEPSYPEEEEAAWIYAMLFIGLILGDYSFNSRKPPDDCDDVPKLRL